MAFFDNLDGGQFGAGLTLGLNPATGNYEIMDQNGSFVSLEDLKTAVANAGAGAITNTQQLEEALNMGTAGNVLGTIQQGVGIAGQIGQIFRGGGAPADVSKFALEAYPLMYPQARSTGLPVYAYWFQGQIVAVLPDGNYGTVLTKPTLADAYSWWEDRANSVSFYVLECGGQGSALLSGCNFRLYGAGHPADTLGVGTGAGAGRLPTLTTGAGLGTGALLIVLFMGGLVALLIFLQKRGK